MRRNTTTTVLLEEEIPKNVCPLLSMALGSPTACIHKKCMFYTKVVGLHDSCLVKEALTHGLH